MTDSAAKLLDLLHERRLLPDLLIDSLRKQVAASSQPLNAHHIAKLLQQKGKITAYQARELLAEVEGRPFETPPASPDRGTVGKSEEKPQTTPAAGDGDDLGLALIEEDVPKTQRREAKSSPASKPSATKAEQEQPSPLAASLDAAPSLGGGIDDLLSDPSLTQTANANYDPLGIAKPQRKRGWLSGLVGSSAKRKPKAGGWESPLLIVGGGALLLLLLVGGTLALVLLRSSGDELFKAAELDYSNGAYGQAVGKYEKFLQGRGQHPQASLARVRIALARLRAASASGDPQTALTQAQTTLPPLAGEPALAEVRPELASLLPGIAEKFADAAAKTTDTQLARKHVDHYRAAMELVDNPLYLPTSVKAPLTAQLERMQSKIDAAQREIEQADRLSKAIAAIEDATKKQDSAAAYKKHHELLTLYPRLSGNVELRAAVAGISASLRDQVKSTESALAPATDDHPSPAIAQIALAKPSGQRIEALAGHVVPVVIYGALHVLAAEDGKLLWRRFVGRDVESARLIADDEAAGVLVIDSQRQELLRLQASDGKLVWRLALGEPFFIGPLARDQLLLTLSSGKLLSLNAATGEVATQIEFPQRLTAPAAASASGDTLFQCGDHSNLYVLDAESLTCRAVHYLGHKAGTIGTPPQLVGPLVVVPQQTGLRRAQLHVLKWIADEAVMGAAQQPLPIDQQIALPLLAEGNRAAVVDRRGAIRIVEAQEAGDAATLSIVAEKSGTTEDSAPFAVLTNGLLAIADQRLAGYRLRSARGTLPAAWVSHDGDQFVAPLHVAKDYVFHARRQSGKPGEIVAAAALAPQDPQDAGQPIWQTHLAHEPAGAVKEKPVGEIEVRSSAGETFALGTVASGDRALNLLQTDRIPPAEFTSQRPTNSVPWRDGILLPNEHGQIEFLSPETHQESDPSPALLFPFQPTLRPGERIQWRPPAEIDGDRFVAADRAGRVYTVAVSDAGAPHLAAVAAAQVGAQLVAGPVVLGQHALVVQRGEEADALIAIAIADLQPGEPLALVGRVVWGPKVIGEAAFVATDPGGLVAIASPAVQSWACDLRGVTPIGEPLAAGESLWIATSAGRLLRLARKTGDLQHTIDFGQPLGSGPAIINEKLIVCTRDGAVLVAEAPP